MNKFLNKLRRCLPKLQEIWDEITEEYPPNSTQKFDIIVNGKSHEFYFDSIYYDELVFMAHKNYKTIYTITYFKGPEMNPEGSIRLDDGDAVEVQDGMVFTVVNCSKA